MFRQSTGKRLTMILLVGIGAVASFFYIWWWTRKVVEDGPHWLLLGLPVLLFVVAQGYCVWYIYLRARQPDAAPPSGALGLTVDVLLPTYNESLDLIEQTLKSVLGVSHPHNTFVIDDGRDPAVEALAQRLGARYLTRSGNEHHKAGNINNALQFTTGDIVAVFDIDHAPDPGFLDRVVPHFANPKVGVVQVALDHSNREESFVAAACSRMSDQFFGATMFGMNAAGSAVVFGTNAVFRRSALESLGGYQPGLAEDLNTSIHLHAKGWESRYVPQLLAKGLVPADLTAFYRQQYKWARGVFESLLRLYPRLFARLTAGQRISYATRMTYYLAGALMAGHILAVVLASFTPQVRPALDAYLLHAIPFFASVLLVHVAANNIVRLKPDQPEFDLRGDLLVLCSWPVYTLALIATLLRIPQTFVATPKERTGANRWLPVLPQVFAVALLLGSTVYGLFSHSDSFFSTHSVAALALAGLHLALVPAIVRWRH
jgi:cellulose synthase (UDP-forming)